MRVFISYRRDDAAGHAGRLYDALTSRFGASNVFMDVDTIQPGADFVEVVESAVSSCDVLIALIGRTWSTAVDAGGRRRLDDPRDLVRVEIETALNGTVHVVPVLVQGAAPPVAEALPGALGGLARRNALELSDARWRHDVGRLVDTLERVAQEKAAKRQADTLPWGRPEIALPVPATPFLGRERELAEVGRLLQDADVRLLTLTGPGGIGKTRLALEAAAGAAERFPDGISWIRLAPLRDPSLVLPEVAQAVSAREQPGRSLADAVATALAGRRFLLVLDNAERLLPGVAAQVAALLDDCPTLAVLVTSRERLQVAAEHVYSVPTLGEVDATALFVERARALDPAFEETAAVAELCRRLDRLPLALELAAARTPLFTAEQLLDRLTQRLDLLKAGRDADPRQQTLRTAIDWSYELLVAEERHLFERLAVFPGGCELEAAERVCEADPDLLQALLEKSLLRRRRDEGRDPRFWMLETIREFAAEKLESGGEAHELRTRHAGYFLELAEAADVQLREGHDQALWLHRIDGEHDNLRAAAEWLAESGESEPELRLTTDIGHLWEIQGHFFEGQQLLEGALERAPKEPTPLRTRALMGAGNLAYERGEYGLATVRLEESLAIARSLDDRGRAARCLNNLGAVALGEGDLERARSVHAEALSLFRELGDERIVGISTGNLGYIELLRGEHGRAGELLRQAVAVLREVDDQVSLPGQLHSLALLALEQGDPPRAADFSREGLELAATVGDRGGITVCLESLAASQPEPREAAQLLGAAAGLRDADGGSLLPFEQALHERTVAALREHLGAEAFARLWDDGGAMTLDEAVAYALESEL